MSEQIDWSKAPPDATHYLPDDDDNHECWLKPGFAVRLDRNSHDWLDDPSARRKIEEGLAIPRPTIPSWSGEGLPPVGVVCEYNPMPVGKPKKWHKVEVVYASEWVIVMRCIDAPSGHEGGNGVEIAMAVDSCSLEDIRPIRTPEQIAPDEREAAIGEMVQAIYLARCSLDCTPLSPDDEAKCASAALYDAGFRKP